MPQATNMYGAVDMPVVQTPDAHHVRSDAEKYSNSYYESKEFKRGVRSSERVGKNSAEPRTNTPSSRSRNDTSAYPSARTPETPSTSGAMTREMVSEMVNNAIRSEDMRGAPKAESKRYGRR
jgi:hypothetical protein